MAETKSVSTQARETVDFLKSGLPEILQNPKVAIICGSGLGGLADSVSKSNLVEYDYKNIPNFPQSTAPGHAGKLLFGFLGESIPVVLMVGRTHYYEGHSIDKVTFPVRVFSLLGVKNIVVTNASGGLNPDYEVGDIVVLNDHLFLAGLAGVHPLRGPNAEDFGVRFTPLSDAYDLELRRTTHQAWKKVIPADHKRRIHEGVYAYVGGPSYETRAECRMLRQLGADLVGMSTVPEIVVARHCGIKILALSLVTNKAVLAPVPRGDDHLLQNSSVDELNVILNEGKANHEEVLEEGKHAAADMQRLVAQILVDAFESRAI